MPYFGPQRQHGKKIYIGQLPPSVMLKKISIGDLHNISSPLCVAICGVIFNVQSHPSGDGFYGPGERYHVFVGTEASYGLATMNLNTSEWKAWQIADKNNEGCSGAINNNPLQGLSAEEKNTLVNWLKHFAKKYSIYGYIPDILSGPPPLTQTAHDSGEYLLDITSFQEVLNELLGLGIS